ncbi:flagellar export chaperone FlgN [Paucidesulfovibrio longus]|uniref:flagellar export chaperone FlgN n=1 Tax=Paucidesulfovibrio longus TaxID=889 RepID=UPI0003B6F508|nr:flagellar export chaperone FlgN [Paucidesulfovibrio longus]
MLHRLKENLARQGKAMLLLHVLLEEEFSRLQDRDSRGVSPLELSIQELMRQLMREREDLSRTVGILSEGKARKVRELLPLLAAEDRAGIEAQLKTLDDDEQRCARQASRNQQLALALFEQSSKLLNYMHSKLKPTRVEGYSARGRYASKPGESRLVRGTL